MTKETKSIKHVCLVADGLDFVVSMEMPDPERFRVSFDLRSGQTEELIAHVVPNPDYQADEGREIPALRKLFTEPGVFIPAVQPGDFVRTARGGYSLISPWAHEDDAWLAYRASDGFRTILWLKNAVAVYRGGVLIWNMEAYGN